MPTIGQPKFLLAGSDPDFALEDFGCDDFVPLVFTREEDALEVAFRFAGMAFYVNYGLRILQAAIGRPQKASTANRSLRSGWKSRLLRTRSGITARYSGTALKAVALRRNVRSTQHADLAHNRN